MGVVNWRPRANVRYLDREAHEIGESGTRAPRTQKEWKQMYVAAPTDRPVACPVAAPLRLEETLTGGLLRFCYHRPRVVMS